MLVHQRVNVGKYSSTMEHLGYIFPWKMRKWGPPPSRRHWKEQHHGRLPWVAEDLGRHRAGGAAEGRHRCSMVLRIWIPTFARTKSPSYVGKELVNIPYIHGAYGISFHFPSPFSEWPEGDWWSVRSVRSGRAWKRGEDGRDAKAEEENVRPARAACGISVNSVDFSGFQWNSIQNSSDLMSTLD